MAEQEAREARREAEQLRSDLATAKEAVRRFMCWLESAEGYDREVIKGVYHWATRDGMDGPLPPSPEWLARREQQEDSGPLSP
jgi:hypothetical protein